jgi:hypothetical protein
LRARGANWKPLHARLGGPVRDWRRPRGRRDPGSGRRQEKHPMVRDAVSIGLWSPHSPADPSGQRPKPAAAGPTAGAIVQSRLLSQPNFTGDLGQCADFRQLSPGRSCARNLDAPGAGTFVGTITCPQPRGAVASGDTHCARGTPATPRRQKCLASEYWLTTRRSRSTGCRVLFVVKARGANRKALRAQPTHRGENQ